MKLMILAKLSMKKIYSIIAILVMVAILVPLLGLAERNSFCDRLEETFSRTDKRITDRELRLKDKHSQISDRIDERREERDDKLKARRDKWDTNRSEHFTKLEEKATTDEQKQAVVAFTKIISSAVSARRRVIKNAIEEFRSGLNGLKLSRKSSVNNATIAYGEEIRTAFEKAKTYCETNPGTARKNLQDDLKQARDNFGNNRREIDRSKDQIEELIASKKETIKKAVDDFKITLQEALVDLKSAFPED